MSGRYDWICYFTIMNKRDFLKIGGLTLLSPVKSILESSEVLHKMSQQDLPSKWIWMRPDVTNSIDDWKRIFAELKDIGFEAVLPEVYSSKEALFAIDGYPYQEALLEKMIPLAHEADLEMHAWMWTMPCNHTSIVDAHPDWYVVNRRGESAHNSPAYVPYYKFLCPRKEEVRQFVQHRVRTLANIEALDGIHLDYVRMPDAILAKGLQPKYDIIQDKEYPAYDYCYCDTCREAFKVKYDIDPLDLSEPEHHEDWRQFRYDAVADLVNDYLVPEAKKANKKITAAVFPNWESVRQQWHNFDLDGFLPMLYHGFYLEDEAWIGEQVQAAHGRMEERKPVYSGLFLGHCKENGVKQAVESALAGGAKGVAVFAYGDWQINFKQELKEALAVIP